MYKTTVSNNYRVPARATLRANQGSPTAQVINPGTTVNLEFKDSGDVFYIDVPGHGTINVLDIGTDRIPGDPLKPAWGILFEMNGYTVVGRYEGMGAIKLTIDKYGTVHLSGANISYADVDVEPLVVDTGTGT